MVGYSQIKAALDDLQVDFQLIEHPAVFTAEEADKYVEDIACMKTKSLFLTDRKKTAYYLVFVKDDHRLDMKKFAQILGKKHLKFASEADLLEKLGIKSGSVSIFSLLNNKAKDIQVYFEKSVIDDLPLTFHPNDNTKTLLLKPEDLFKFLDNIEFSYQIVEL